MWLFNSCFSSVASFLLQVVPGAQRVTCMSAQIPPRILWPQEIYMKTLSNYSGASVTRGRRCQVAHTGRAGASVTHSSPPETNTHEMSHSFSGYQSRIISDQLKLDIWYIWYLFQSHRLFYFEIWLDSPFRCFHDEDEGESGSYRSLRALWLRVPLLSNHQGARLMDGQPAIDERQNTPSWFLIQVHIEKQVTARKQLRESKTRTIPAPCHSLWFTRVGKVINWIQTRRND